MGKIAESMYARISFVISTMVYAAFQVQLLFNELFSTIRPIIAAVIALCLASALLSMRKGMLVHALMLFFSTVVASSVTYFAYAVWFTLFR